MIKRFISVMIEGIESLTQYDSTDVQQYDSKSVHL